MANFSSQQYAGIARPYALAAFEYARDKGGQSLLLAWQTFLSAAKQVMENDDVRRLLGNPENTTEKSLNIVVDLLSAVLKKEISSDGAEQPLIDAHQLNFLKIVAKNKRSLILPEISIQFDALLADYDKASFVRVVTAVETNAEYKQLLKQALTRRIQREVTLQYEIDPSVIGGAVIYIGDKVIDGSVRGKLSRLLEFSLR